MSSSNSPCAACKFLRRKCTQECVYAPYFPPENPQRFACVHRVFGASNVAKILNELSASQREEAVKSLAYEAEARLRDPVYGCVGFIYVLQQHLREIRANLVNAKKELATYGNPQTTMQELLSPQALQGIPLPTNAVGNPLASSVLYPSYGGNPTQLQNAQLVLRDPQQQELLEAQQAQQLAVAAAAREQQQAMMRAYEQQQQQQEIMRFNAGFEPSAGSAAVAVAGSGGFVQMNGHNGGQGEMSTPSLALGGTFNNVVGAYQMQQQQQHGEEHHVGNGHGHHRHPIEEQLLLSPQQTPHSQQQQQSLSEISQEGRSVGPSS